MKKLFIQKSYSKKAIEKNRILKNAEKHRKKPFKYEQFVNNHKKLKSFESYFPYYSWKRKKISQEINPNLPSPPSYIYPPSIPSPFSAPAYRIVVCLLLSKYISESAPVSLHRQVQLLLLRITQTKRKEVKLWQMKNTKQKSAKFLLENHASNLLSRSQNENGRRRLIVKSRKILNTVVISIFLC